MSKTIFVTKKNIITAFFILLTSFVTPVFALPWFTPAWHPVLTLGVGAANSSHVGESRNFPIVTPFVDQFYNYSINNDKQTSLLVHGFLGAEWNNLFEVWGLQAGIAYNQPSRFTARGTLTQGFTVGSASTFNYQYKILSKQLLFETKLVYLRQRPVHPYVLAGLGAANNNASDFTTSVPGFLTFTRQYSDQSTTTLSWALGIGFDVEVANNVRLGLGYQFTDLGKAKLGQATILSFNAPGTLSQSHLYVNELLGQLTLVYC